MKRSIQLVALLLTVFMGSCTGGKDKAAAEHVDAKPIVKLADVKARPVDQIQDYTASGEPEHQPNCKTRQCDGDGLQAGYRGH